MCVCVWGGCVMEEIDGGSAAWVGVIELEERLMVGVLQWWKGLIAGVMQPGCV